MTSIPLYIFDLDGTLADLKHRRKFVELQDGSPVTVNGTPAIFRGLNPKIEGDYWIEFPSSKSGLWSYSPNDVKFRKDWDAFHAACVDDTPIVPVVKTFCTLWSNVSVDIWVWSGRSDAVEAQTRSWLVKHVVPLSWTVAPSRLKMRPAGDYMPDDKLKESWLHAMSPEDRARLVAVFDDRQRVVDMWRRNGVQCFQVAPGNF